MPDFSPVDYAIPGFVLLVLAEMLWARFKAPHSYEPKDTLVSLAFGLGSTVAGLLLGGFWLAVFLAAYEVRFFTIGWEWWAWPMCFVLDDLKYYWVHRFGHRSRWFWASHVNHHSSQHYNLSTALRQTWTGAFTLGFLFALPLVLLGGAIPALLGYLDWQHALLGVALIFIIRPISGMLALWGDPMSLRQRGVVAFYGVRGIGSIYYLAYAGGQLNLVDEGALWATVTFTILLSTIVHGFSAGSVVWAATHEGERPSEPT